jgi:hypothetical protein
VSRGNFIIRACEMDKPTRRPGKTNVRRTIPMMNETSNRMSCPHKDGEAFPTIDGTIDLAKELHARLVDLGRLKHPLQVRRASALGKGVRDVSAERDSLTLKAGGRTYFFDIEKTSQGSPYLRITESRLKGKEGERDRNTIIIFREDAKGFADAILEMVGKIS